MSKYFFMVLGGMYVLSLYGMEKDTSNINYQELTQSEDEAVFWEEKILQALAEPTIKKSLNNTHDFANNISFCSQLPENVYHDIIELLCLREFQRETAVLQIVKEPLNQNSFVKWKDKYKEKIVAKSPYNKCFLVPSKLYFTKPLATLRCKLLTHKEISEIFYFYFTIDPHNNTVHFLSPEPFNIADFFGTAGIQHKKPLINYMSKPQINIEGASYRELTYKTNSAALESIEDSFHKEKKKKNCIIM